MTQDNSQDDKSCTNRIELIGIYGGDETHALSAWTSTSRDLSDEKRARMDKLLNTLARDGHHTPFEKSSIHFLMTTDIATHIQLLKHRVGVSINSESARYKELRDDKYYVPTDWDEQERALYIAHCEESLMRYHRCLERLIEKGVPRKRAKESARFYLPYGNQYTIDLMCNFRSYTHLVKLRYDSHAQLEIRDLMGESLKLVHATGAFNMSLKAFGVVDDTSSILPPT